MTLLERLLHAVRTADAELEEVRIELPENASVPTDLPAEITDALPLRWSRGEGPMASRLDRALEEMGAGPKVLLCANTVVDTRVVHYLCTTKGTVAFRSGEGDERGAALRIEGPLRDEGADAVPQAKPRSVLSLADDLVDRGIAKDLAEGDFDSYLTMLRRTLAPYVFRIADLAARDRVEHFLFWSNYKGSTDFLTRYVYPPLVWMMVRPLARWRVHPNWVTALSWVATFAAVPLFAAGAWIPGLALAYLMSVMDSVDGKLARLTYTSSKIGEVLDHGLDIVHPPIWYMAWGYALGGGSFASTPFQASLWLLASYVIDRIIAGIFKARHGRSIHGFTPLDERVRTFISRRNVNLALITVALLLDGMRPGLGAAELTFGIIVFWQVACMVWHLERLAQFWNNRPQQ